MWRESRAVEHRESLEGYHSIALCSGSLRRGGVICFADRCWETETVDNDIHHAENACLPAGLVVHEAYPDHRAHEISGVDI